MSRFDELRIERFPPQIKVKWADGWNAKRLLRRKIWGFKGQSKWTGRLNLGDVVKREHQGAVEVCTDQAVHVAYTPWHPWVRYYGGGFRRTYLRKSFFIVVMDDVGRVKEHWYAWHNRNPAFDLNAKWAGTQYTVVAQVRVVKGTYPNREWMQAWLESQI